MRQDLPESPGIQQRLQGFLRALLCLKARPLKIAGSAAVPCADEVPLSLPQPPLCFPHVRIHGICRQGNYCCPQDISAPWFSPGLWTGCLRVRTRWSSRSQAGCGGRCFPPLRAVLMRRPSCLTPGCRGGGGGWGDDPWSGRPQGRGGGLVVAKKRRVCHTSVWRRGSPWRGAVNRDAKAATGRLECPRYSHRSWGRGRHHLWRYNTRPGCPIPCSD